MQHQGPCSANEAETTVVDVDGIEIAYRAFGASDGAPLVFCHRFRGTMDHWDPLFVDTIAAQRPVVLFDSAGVGRSGGAVPTSLREMADIALATVGALGLDVVDVLGWSMGGGVAQHMALRDRGAVRRLVLAGTGPGAVPDAPAPPEQVGEIAGKPVNDDDDFMYLFFHDSSTSKQAGREHLQRLGRRLEPFGPQVSAESFRAQLHALIMFSAGADATIGRLGDIQQPVLVANGHHDRMVHAFNSWVMAQQLAEAELVLYPDAGHGFLFQVPERFGARVSEFLARP